MWGLFLYLFYWHNFVMSHKYIEKFTPLFLVILSAILFSLSQTPFNAGILRFIMLVPLLYIIKGEYSINKTLLYVWIFGYVYLLIQYSVSWDVLPLEWIGFDSKVCAIIVVGLIWFIYSAILALPFLILLFSRKSLLLFPFLFVIAEYGRSALYALLMLGGPSTIRDNFSYGISAYSVHTSEILLFFAPYLKVYGYSFIIAIINAILFFYIKKSAIDSRFVFIPLLIFVLLIGIEVMPVTYTKHHQGEPVQVLVLQGQNSNTTNPLLANTNIYKDVLEEFSDAHIDIAIFPENSRFLRIISQTENKSELESAKNIFDTTNINRLVYGDYDFKNNKYIISSISKDSNNFDRVEKQVLMAFGEYQPYITQTVAKLTRNKEWLNTVQEGRELSGATSKSLVLNTEHGNMATITCSEIFAPHIYNNLRKSNPKLIIQEQRLSIFHENTRVWKHSIAASKIYASMLRTPIVGSVDGSGYSYIIDKYGRINSIGEPDATHIYGEVFLN